MKFTRFFAVAAVSVFMTLSAFGQASRTWVSGVGSDANPCSRTAPCKTFAGAISKTASGGVISVLDPGGYGAVTITQPITIEGNGTLASILAGSTNAITVNITSGTNRNVVLRHLLLDGQSELEGGMPAANGIQFLDGDSLTVEECYIESFTKTGISFESKSDARLAVKNTSILLTDTAIFVAPGSTATATISNSSLLQNTTGVHVQDNTRLNISHSTVSENTGDGIFADGLTPSGLTVLVENCEVANNSTGIHSNGSATTRVANSAIVGNAKFGLNITASSQIVSYQNNRLTQNGTNGVFSQIVNPND
jgi:hypothetical protein